MKYQNSKGNIDVGIIAIDFDGTITQETCFPDCGAPNMQVIRGIIEAKVQGYKVILWTNRQNDNIEYPGVLDKALKYCSDFGIKFDAVNDNIPEVLAIFPNNTRKITADYYIDDKTPGTIEWFIKKFGG